jgi:hypothetical protein
VLRIVQHSVLMDTLSESDSVHNAGSLQFGEVGFPVNSGGGRNRNMSECGLTSRRIFLKRICLYCWNSFQINSRLSSLTGLLISS